MKLVKNSYDTVPNRLIVTDATQRSMLSIATLSFCKDMLGRLKAQTHQISGMASKLDLEIQDLTTVAVRLKEVLDRYFRPLEKAIEEGERYMLHGGGRFKSLAASYLVSAADAELRALRFTLDLTEAEQWKTAA